MAERVRPIWRYALAATLGALFASVLFVVVSKAIPRMMSRAMAGMMENTMGHEGQPGGQLPDP